MLCVFLKYKDFSSFIISAYKVPFLNVLKLLLARNFTFLTSDLYSRENFTKDGCVKRYI